MKLLDIVKQCCYRTGDNTVNNLFADEDNAREWLGYISQAVPQIIREHNWSMLTKDRVFETIDDVNEYALPTDYNRIASYYLYNVTKKKRLNYANNDMELNRVIRGRTEDDTFRIMGGNFVIAGKVVGGERFIYTYITNNVVKDTNGLPKDGFTSNEDTFLLSDELLILKAIHLRAVNLGLPEVDRREQDYNNFLRMETSNDGANVQFNLFEEKSVKTTPDEWRVYD